MKFCLHIVTSFLSNLFFILTYYSYHFNMAIHITIYENWIIVHITVKDQITDYLTVHIIFHITIYIIVYILMEVSVSYV